MQLVPDQTAQAEIRKQNLNSSKLGDGSLLLLPAGYAMNCHRSARARIKTPLQFNFLALGFMWALGLSLAGLRVCLAVQKGARVSLLEKRRLGS